MRVVVLLRNRIVLVVVAARARDRHPQEAAGDDVDAIVAFVGAGDFDRAVVVVPRAEAEQAERRQHARPLRFVDQVAGELGAHELVVRHVVVDRADDPIAIEIRVRIRRVAAGLRVEAARIVFAVARDVEPFAAPRLAVLRRRQQAIDHVQPRVGRTVLLERVDLFGRRLQAGEVDRRAADQGAAVGRAHRRQPVLLQLGQHEAIDVGLRPVVGLHRGRRAGVNRHERPERALVAGDRLVGSRRRRCRRGGRKRRADLDPLGQRRDVGVGELRSALRHLQTRAHPPDRVHQQTLVGIAGGNRRSRIAAEQNRLA